MGNNYQYFIKNFKFLNKVFFLVLSLVLILISIYGGARHDYYLYTIIWESFIGGKESIPLNTYGPIHLLLSFIYKLNLLVPKLLFGISFILLNYYIFRKILKKNKFTLIIFFYLTIHCNFLIISFAFFYGINDFLFHYFLLFQSSFLRKKKLFFLAFLFL